MDHLQKSKERIQKFKETRYSRHIYQNELDKTCFQHNIPYGEHKDLSRIAASDEVLCAKAFEAAKKLKYGR